MMKGIRKNYPDSPQELTDHNDYYYKVIINGITNYWQKSNTIVLDEGDHEPVQSTTPNLKTTTMSLETQQLILRKAFDNAVTYGNVKDAQRFGKALIENLEQSMVDYNNSTNGIVDSITQIIESLESVEVEEHKIKFGGFYNTPILEICVMRKGTGVPQFTVDGIKPSVGSIIALHNLLHDGFADLPIQIGSFKLNHSIGNREDLLTCLCLYMKWITDAGEALGM